MSSQFVHGPSTVERHNDLSIPVGTETLAATRYEPVDIDDALPVILVAYPYRKDDRLGFGLQDESLQYLARNGYEAVVVDLPGTGASSGTKEWGFGPEGDALVDAIEWLAAREWSSGHVGMYGLSWGGLTQLQAAAQRPAALEAIVPVAIARSPFEVFYPGGAFDTLRWPTWATTMVASQALPPSKRDVDGRWADIWHDHLDDLRDLSPWLFDWLDHDTFDAFWEAHRVAIDAIDVPTFLAVGYRDIHTQSVTEYYDEIDAPKRLLLGPWRHTFPHLGHESAVDFRRQAVEWYDHHIKGADNVASDHAPIEYWTERDGGWTPDAGVWRARDAWPTAAATTDAECVSFALAPDGLVPEAAFTEGAVKQEYDPDATVGVDSVQRIAGLEIGDRDTSEDDRRSLVFETAPLDRPIEFTGTGRLTLRIEPTTPDALLVGRLSDVAPDGTATPVTHGYRSASRWTGPSGPTQVTPGTEYDVEIPLLPRSHVFERDHRLRLAISAALFPRARAPSNQGPFTVRSSSQTPSTLTHPGIRHDAEVTFDDTVTMEAPDTEAVSTDSEYVVDADADWHVERDPAEETVSFMAESHSTIELPHGVDMTIATTIDASASADTPNSAAVRNDATFTLEYDTERVEAEATSRVSHDYALLSVVVTVDGQTAFKQTWRR